ncbi:hypothetical protein [Embleya sp. NPDC050493]|uniref:hypothetical protein n=1 Tax=Embleya sp. NPDC050493 TaxID=3363989 RepID=UPI00378D53D3
MEIDELRFTGEPGPGASAPRTRGCPNRLPKRAWAGHAYSVIDLPAAASEAEYRAIAWATMRRAA